MIRWVKNICIMAWRLLLSIAVFLVLAFIAGKLIEVMAPLLGAIIVLGVFGWVLWALGNDLHWRE